MQKIAVGKLRGVKLAVLQPVCGRRSHSRPTLEFAVALQLNPKLQGHP